MILQGSQAEQLVDRALPCLRVITEGTQANEFENIQISVAVVAVVAHVALVSVR
jgi:hypothetical protein